MYQKIEKYKGIRALKVSSGELELEKGKGEGEGAGEKKHEKFLTSIILDTRLPFKSPGHRYYRVKYASHFVHQLPR